ncbi:MAG: cytochrome c oxidase subunit II [Thermosynechococcaceae cyanobacterium]
MKVPNTITALLIGITLTLVSLWVGQNNGMMPISASAEAPKIDGLFNAMLSISAGLFLLVQGALLYSVFRFRRKPGDDTDAAPIEGNVPLEILWTAIPTVIVMWLAVYSFDVYQSVDSGNAIGSNHMAHAHRTETVAIAPHSVAQPGSAFAATLPTQTGDMTQAAVPGLDLMAPATAANKSDEPLVINVNGLQYAWIFTYPDTGIVAGEMHLPVDRPVRLNISASDVIHAFWVPEFRLKQDAVPGQENHLSFIPSRVGTYPLICAELCGAYHGGMKTKVIVQAPEDYQTWVQSQTTAAVDATTLVAAAQEQARQTQVAAMGFESHSMAMDHLHRHAVSTPETLQIAQSL